MQVEHAREHVTVALVELTVPVRLRDEQAQLLRRMHVLHLIDRSIPSPAAPGDTQGDWQLWFELWSRGLRDPLVAKKREALDRRWRATIAQVVRDGQASREFDPVNPDEFALMLASLIDGLAIQAILRDRDATPERLREVCIEVASRELGFKRTKRKAPVRSVAGGAGRGD